MVYTTMALAREGRRGRAVAWEGPEPAVEAAAIERQKAGGHAGGKGSGKLPGPSKGDTEAAEAANKEHICTPYVRFLAL
jgi:hypothetical protein